MSEQLKVAVRGVFTNIEDLRQLTGYYQNLQIPADPSEKGKQTLAGGHYNPGTRVEATGIGPIKEGVKGTVQERYKQNGYWYYVVKWDKSSGKTVERQKDIRGI